MAQVVDNNEGGQSVALIETPGNAPPIDILEIADPPRQMKVEMRMATKTPSEWLRLLCRDWSQENEDILSSMDDRFIQYKSYLKGRLTSQLLCRLSMSREGPGEGPNEFWKILGVQDEFDRSHITANVERFCSLYNIRGTNPDEMVPDYGLEQGLQGEAAAMAQGAHLLYQLDQSNAKNSKAQQTAMKNEMRRIKAENRERDREEYTLRKAAEKAAREQTREERRQRKLAMKKQREEYAHRQKEAALQRAAELVQSNRIPVEITRGVAAANGNELVDNAPSNKDASVLPYTMTSPDPPPKKSRSSIVISTASDLDRIVTHSNNLWAKYNAIAKEHNQRVNWVVVAKELGIHVKVREKYARMHSRALARGFDFQNWGHYRIKDYPEYFIDPLGPTIEAALHANAVAAPKAAHDVTTFNTGTQSAVHPAMNATLGLAAQVVAAGGMNTVMGADTFSDVSSAAETESVPLLVPRLASEVQAPQMHGEGVSGYTDHHHDNSYSANGYINDNGYNDTSCTVPQLPPQETNTGYNNASCPV